MRYVAIGFILLFGSCSLSTRTTSKKEPVPPTVVAPENAGTIDRNNDGIVSPSEIDAISNTPGSLTVFLWLIFAVILAVGITMILSKWSPTKLDKECDVNSNLLRSRASALDKEHKKTPPFYKPRSPKKDTKDKPDDEPKK